MNDLFGGAFGDLFGGDPFGGHQDAVRQRQLVGSLDVAREAVVQDAREGHLAEVVVDTILPVADELEFLVTAACCVDAVDQVLPVHAALGIDQWVVTQRLNGRVPEGFSRIGGTTAAAQAWVVADDADRGLIRFRAHPNSPASAMQLKPFVAVAALVWIDDDTPKRVARDGLGHRDGVAGNLFLPHVGV